MSEKTTSFRHTVAKPFSLTGCGLHTGTQTTVTVSPAQAHTGITFFRADLTEAEVIPASVDFVTSVERRTELAVRGQTISTVEHLLAAVYACEIDDAYITAEGAELPILDGSARPFVDAFFAAGRMVHAVERRNLVVDQPIAVTSGDARYEVRPAAGTIIDVSISFDHLLIGDQTVRTLLTPQTFAAELASARTFGFVKEADALRSRDLIQGAREDNVIVLTEDGLLNGQSLRWPDEFARHKAVDLIGDLALLGMPIRGEIVAHRPSHAGNVALARAIRDHATLQ